MPGHGLGPEWIDAHLHLQDGALREALGEAPDLNGISGQLVNGTCPADWESVRQLASSPGRTLWRAYGLHPWKVEAAGEGWLELLRGYLEKDAVSVGEMGLDHWVEPRDEALQIEAFDQQLQLAKAIDIPPTLHCLRAWGLLVERLRSGPDLRHGFLVHGFGGSLDILYQLLEMGGYVSFSAYAAAPNRKRMREALRACPVDRLLLETDAPDMVPRTEDAAYPLQDADGHRLHHPREIETAYALAARLRGEALETLTAQVRENFFRLFTRAAP
jgi:TatD DNase family protein